MTRTSPTVYVPKGLKQRRLHKSFLRYHDANNWPEIREALRRMGRSDLIGAGKHQLVPAWQPAGTGGAPPKPEGAGPVGTVGGPRPFRTQHTGVESGRKPVGGTTRAPQMPRPGGPRPVGGRPTGGRPRG